MTYTDGYNKAMTLSTRNDFCDSTYAYDSSRRISKPAAKDTDYVSASTEYRRGFAIAIYNLHRC